MEQIEGMKESIGVEEQENDFVGRELQRFFSLFLFLPFFLPPIFSFFWFPLIFFKGFFCSPFHGSSLFLSFFFFVFFSFCSLFFGFPLPILSTLLRNVLSTHVGVWGHNVPIIFFFILFFYFIFFFCDFFIYIFIYFNIFFLLF